MIETEYQTDFFERTITLKEAWMRSEEEIEKLLNNLEKRLGEGKTALVTSLNIDEEPCLKVYKKKENGIVYKVSPKTELDKMIELQNLGNDIGVFVPEPHLVGNHDDLEFILMEKVKGYTIKDIVTNNIELPANFSLDDFIGRVKEFLARMHEKRIYHRDLHWDNIMIEKGTGKIYIIDFGSSTSSFGDDESEIYREKTPSGETITFKTDEDEFKEVCKELRNYLLTN